jgi:hypothetical protein
MGRTAGGGTTVIDPQSTSALQAILLRESRSLLQYTAEAFPWTSVAGEPALAELRQLIRDEASAVAALGQYLVRRRVPLPYLGSFPSSFTTTNFIGLEYLLPRLVEVEQGLVRDLEGDPARITDADARRRVEGLLAAKRASLRALERLAAARLEPAGA